MSEITRAKQDASLDAAHQAELNEYNSCIANAQAIQEDANQLVLDGAGDAIKGAGIAGVGVLMLETGILMPEAPPVIVVGAVIGAYGAGETAVGAAYGAYGDHRLRACGNDPDEQ
jgi:hypothetical protein